MINGAQARGWPVWTGLAGPGGNDRSKIGRNHRGVRWRLRSVLQCSVKKFMMLYAVTRGRPIECKVSDLFPAPLLVGTSLLARKASA